ncbi:HsdM family class I SAM-dependent methyltransferase [Mycoplasma sp. 5912]
MDAIYLNTLLNTFPLFSKEDGVVTIRIKNAIIKIDLNNEKWSIENFKNFGHQRIFDLSKNENWSVLMLVASLLEKGYKKSQIYLEKSWKLGHNTSGFADVVVSKDAKPYYIFEVKDINSIHKYINHKYAKHTMQIFSYLFQDKNIKVGSYYTYNFINQSHQFFNIFINDILTKAESTESMYEIWNKQWDISNFVFNNNLFEAEFQVIKYHQLKKIDSDAVKLIFNQFLSILRQNSVSDKSNAFDKMINIFIAKVYDEILEDSNFEIDGQKINGMQFQFINNIDNDLSFLKRLNDLYKNGMNYCMKKQIIDYSDSEIESIIENNDNKQKLRQVIDDLRLKKNNAFSFIEVFDDKTFIENNGVLKEMVLLLQSYKFKYNNKHQFLGDFFEELLNTSWKQESGQFFTPMPIVEFMVNSLPIETIIKSKLEQRNIDFIPKMIDYASGSGHFLVSYMDYIENVIQKLQPNYTSAINKLIQSYQVNPFSWANEHVIGIEKDYRLAKTSKISTFLNGDGEAQIINADGINKFNSIEFINSPLYTEKTFNPFFDFVIANPPFSVAGFLKNVLKNNVSSEDFSLLKTLDAKSSEIEVLFIERTYQLLKDDAYAAIILPRSFLTAAQYATAREFVLTHFKIRAIFESADITFSGTTTSPIILFMQKQEKVELNYNILVINSPKTLFGSNNAEKEFLGYEFSTNRNKLGITLLNDNLKQNYAPIVKEFLTRNTTSKLNKFTFIKNINQMLLLDKDQKRIIYPRFNKPKTGYISINDIADVINPVYDKNVNYKYLEISDIQNGKIKHENNKNKKSSKVALKGDIVFSSLPNAKKIAIADDNYFVSAAIYVIRITDKKIRDNFYNYIYNNTNNIIYDMNVLLDGFKITYAKISEYNFKNNVFMQKDLIFKK